MKKKLLSIMAALSLAFGASLIAAPGANAAATFHCYAYPDELHPSTKINACVVVNGVYVQGYITIHPDAPARWMTAVNISGGSSLSNSRIYVSDRTYTKTIQRPAGTNFQIMYYVDSILKGYYFSPTIIVG